MGGKLYGKFQEALHVFLIAPVGADGVSLRTWKSYRVRMAAQTLSDLKPRGPSCISYYLQKSGNGDRYLYGSSARLSAAHLG